MRYALLLCMGLVGVMPWCAAAQDAALYTIRGQVLDAETETPLVGAHVFLSNSTHGTVTDSDGRFVLDRLAAGTHEIAVSMLGFALEVTRMIFPGDEQTPHVFRLAPRVLPMGEVVIAAARSEAEARNWERYIDAFIADFIGETPNADKCTLLNPEVLYFTASAPHLEAASTEPLIIENRALGYRIYYHLQAFEAYDAGVRYYGTRRFELLPPRNRRERRRWERARRDTYTGSLPHFLTTLLQATNEHDVRREGFNVGLSPRFDTDPMYVMGVNTEALLRPSATPDHYLLAFPDHLQVLYQPDVPLASSVRMPGSGPPPTAAEYTSWITLNAGPAEIDAFGHFTEPYAVTTYGLWGQSRVADILPRDYRPD